MNFHSNNRKYRPSYRTRTVRNRFIMVAASLAVVAVLAGGTFAALQLFQKDAAVPPIGAPDPASSSGAASGTASTAQKNPTEVSLTRETSFAAWNNSADWKLMVVNASNEVPSSWQVDPDSTTYKNITVDKRIITDLKNMIADAQKDNISLWISSAYRSKERQAQLLQKEIEGHVRDGLSSSEAAVAAVRLVMPAGYSEHQTGLSVDLNGVQEDFYSTAAYEWLCQHAADYGFIERYPQNKYDITGIDFEPWHYRYVGQEAARQIDEQNLCLEEYVFSLMQEE